MISLPCQTCGYDLGGLPSSVVVCPECGGRVSREAPRRVPVVRLVCIGLLPCVILALMAVGVAAVAPGGFSGVLLVLAMVGAGVGPIVAVAMGLGAIGPRLRGAHFVVAACCVVGGWLVNGAVCVVGCFVYATVVLQYGYR